MNFKDYQSKVGLTVKQMFTPKISNSYGVTRVAGKNNRQNISHIVLHTTANTAPARNEALNIHNNPGINSFHAVADEKEVYETVRFENVAHHAGNKWHNQNSIGFELVQNNKIEQGYQNLVKYVGFVMADLNLKPSTKTVQYHHDIVSTSCGSFYSKKGKSQVLKDITKYYNIAKGKAPVQSGENLAIEGNSQLSAEEITAHIRKQNKNFNPKIAEAFIRIGKKYGIRGDVAAAQSILETGWFKFEGSVVKPEQNNFCGLGATGGNNPGHSFKTIEDGVTAQIQHLYAYANKKDLPKGEKLIDPRFKYVQRGIAPKWVDLNGRWATGANYGQKILRIYSEMGGNTGDTQSKPKPTPSAPKYTPKQIAEEIWYGKGNWGNNPERAKKIRAVGLNPDDVQKEIEKIKNKGSQSKPSKPKYTPKQIAEEIWYGKGNWGNNPQRAEKIRAVGLNPADVQKEIDKLAKGKPSAPKPAPKPKLTEKQVAEQIYKGVGGWGNDPQRTRKVKAAGLDPKKVQAEVNKLMSGKSKPSKPSRPKKTAEQIADEIGYGKGNWGTGATRAKRIKDAGVNPDEVQRIINKKYY